MIPSVLIILIVQLFRVQGEVEVVMKDVECPVYNEEYVTEPDMYIDVNNGIYLNVSIIKEFPPTTEAYITLISATMGEYIVDSGIEVQMPLCEMTESFAFKALINLLGVSKNNCPPKPGIYGNNGYTIPTSYFPDNYPPNQYKAVFKIIIEGEDVIVANCFFNIL